MIKTYTGEKDGKTFVVINIHTKDSVFGGAVAKEDVLNENALGGLLSALIDRTLQETAGINRVEMLAALMEEAENPKKYSEVYPETEKAQVSDTSQD